jgi:hypothetical protein
LQRQLCTRRRALGDRSAAEGERDATLGAGAMGQTHLGAGKGAVRHHRGGADAQLGRGELR